MSSGGDNPVRGRAGGEHTSAMLRLSSTFALLLTALSAASGRSVVPPTGRGEGGLFLTPYIAGGDLALARNLSAVEPSPAGAGTSYSGYLTVDDMRGNHLFFWYFPARRDPERAPLVLWLQGGPGGSSMFGLTVELGPFEVAADGPRARPHSWNAENNLLFVDQPVGAGYSFSDTDDYPRDEARVAADLYAALVQFLTLFPDLQRSRVFVTGESYAGHYVPAVGRAIHAGNPAARVKIDLAAMMIGNGLMDADEQIDYADFLYNTGLVDDRQRDALRRKQREFGEKYSRADWTGATAARDSLHDLIDEFTGINRYNYGRPALDETHWMEFIQSEQTRKAIHVGRQPFKRVSGDAAMALLEDKSKSVKPWVEELLEHYPIVFYSGQLDTMDGYPMMVHFLRSLRWSGQQRYLSAERRQWRDPTSGEVVGYVKGVYRLYEVLVRNAGHMVPADRPAAAFQMVNSLTRGSPGPLEDVVAAA